MRDRKTGPGKGKRTMKRYKVNVAYRVHADFSKSGYKWTYRGRTDDPQKWIEEYKKGWTGDGLRITDTETDAVIFEELSERERRAKTI